MQKKLLLIFVLLLFSCLFSCAPPKPVSWLPEVRPFYGAKGLVAYDISTPKGNLKGEAFFLAGSNFVYFEVPSFLGLTVFQGILAKQRLEALNFLAKKAYIFQMKDLLGQTDIPWGALFLGVYPQEWLEEAKSFATKDGYRLDIPLNEKGKVCGYFSKLGVLNKIELKTSKGTLIFRYKKNKTFIEISRLRSKAQFLFKERTFLNKKPNCPKIFIPPYFEVQIYSF